MKIDAIFDPAGMSDTICGFSARLVDTRPLNSSANKTLMTRLKSFRGTQTKKVFFLAHSKIYFDKNFYDPQF